MDSSKLPLQEGDIAPAIKAAYVTYRGDVRFGDNEDRDAFADAMHYVSDGVVFVEDVECPACHQMLCEQQGAHAYRCLECGQKFND